ncbi:MAG: hypothetical protein J7M18_01210, partial [Candidatus Eremiobacteraeota bacterium]|nr:hypothetical protein [Candidatus Eremiobacteraeota bacterium]
MKVRVKITSILIFVLLVAGIIIVSASPLDLDQYTHSEDELGILVLTEKSISRVEELKKRPCPVKIAVLQVPENVLKPGIKKILLDYLEDGGTVWFYDSRLGPIFGMKNSPLNGRDIRYNQYKGRYGDNSRCPGAATYLQAYGNHPVLKGVNLVLAFLLEVGKDQFSGVEVTGDVTPILVGNDPKIAA